MRQARGSLKIFLLSHPILNTEWLSLQGDKYTHLLPFELQLVESPDAAQVIIWDGVISPKSQLLIQKVLTLLQQDKVLLLQGEAQTLLAKHPLVKMINLNQLKYVQLPGWSVLPEALIDAIKQCYQKLGHV